MNASKLFQKELNKISSKFENYNHDDKINLLLDEFNKANDVFGDMMTIKLNDLLDQEQVKLADAIYNGAEDDENDEDIEDDNDEQLEFDLEADGEPESEESDEVEEPEEDDEAEQN